MLNIFRILLLPFSILYGIIAWIRNGLFNVGLLKEHQFEIPIICIGNLNVGGTGKTPHVLLTANYLSQSGKKVAVLSRGYKRQSKGFVLANSSSNHEQIGDEPMELYLKLPQTKIAVCESRVNGIHELMNLSEPPEVIILDDAFQHRYVKPAFSILLTTFKNPYYKDYVLPMGRLREFSMGRRRADVVIVTKIKDNLNEEMRKDIRNKLKLSSSQEVFFSKMNYQEFYNLHDNSKKLEVLDKNWSTYLFTAIADNNELKTYLKSKFDGVKGIYLPDHHSFTLKDVQNLINQFNKDQSANKAIFITAKDAVKLKEFEILRNYPVFVTNMSVELNEGKKFFEILDNKLSSFFVGD